MYHLGMALFEINCFEDVFKMPKAVMGEFLNQVESKYKKTAYHNSVHAADVLHGVHYFIHVLGMSELISAEEIFACYIAAIIHDVDHPGRNNSFMIATSSPLAMMYNDISVLENHHCATGFEILSRPECNLLKCFTPEKTKELRSIICLMVLATDISSHFEYIGKFKNKLNDAGMDFKDHKDKQLIMDLALKCADVSNAAKSTSLSVTWANLIMTEFYSQGDEEKKLGLPVSMFMDRETAVVSKCQVGFIDYIVMPLFELWDGYMNENGIFPAIENIQKTREFWKKKDV